MKASDRGQNIILGTGKLVWLCCDELFSYYSNNESVCLLLFCCVLLSTDVTGTSDCVGEWLII